ncbi:MAG: HAD family hydrolase [Ignavibacteria bacterium]|nr:HAD family hydrolase [Ignavibacteria bacterium]MBT8383266.1 HAD family hydrolase [Ignavibacteria bacterium]MBT8390371.1 HAD family hydrolase [Ignavibacteria bacterium]NNJ53369.1 HAD family hydrolase [Ignavibacteriaceae bacterium]NNL21616.1 HAD family hydrolase [Ignavibacteriaceae bacterium]
MIEKKIARDIKLIVSDLDGTLLSDDGSLGVETRNLIKELIKEGINFSIASGRLHSAVVPTAEALNLNGPLISLDGALVKYHSNGKTIFKLPLGRRQVSKAVNYSEENLINIVLCHADAIYYTDFNTVIPSLLSKFGAEYKKVDSYEEYIKNTLEIVCASDMKDSIKRMDEAFTFPAAIGCTTSFFKSRSYDNIYYLEIRKSGCSKGKGLKRVLKHLNLKPENAVVVGDWYNDISLFKTKAFKVAVANAIPELIHLSDYVTKGTNNEEGAAEIFEMILKAKRN